MFIVKIKHPFIHPYLLVDPGYHHRLVDRLVFSSDIITVKVHIQIIHILYLKQGFKYKNIVHVERFFGKLQPELL